MQSNLLLLSILFPIAAGVVVLFLRQSNIRKGFIAVALAVIVLSSLVLLGTLKVPDVFTASDFYGILDVAIKIADFVLLVYVIYISFKIKEWRATFFAVLQLIPLIYFEFFMLKEHEMEMFFVDELAIIMNLIISIVGSLIALYAFSYMDHHEEHLHVSPTRQPRFFAIILVFLGAMNGLVLSNNLMWMYFFWEVTTLSSFLLIGHDQTEEAIRNAARALWINMMGGFALLLGIIFIYANYSTISLVEVLKIQNASYILLPMFFIAFAAFTKSAQMPFQSWLLGAMVAPTPVSALLHSSTMVKAGIYILLRFSPLFRGTLLSDFIAVYGAFTFLATAFLAVSQSNAKRILAYSTVSNLGLMIASIGINTSSAIAAAILLLIFHAISKALLFLSVGTIEQHIGSRDIEDMKGLINKMPVTTSITFVGILTLMAAPFGMLVSKWLILEVAAGSIIISIILAIGSALTVLYYTRWIGNILSGTYFTKKEQERMDVPVGISLYSLTGLAVILSLMIVSLYNMLVIPQIVNMKMDVALKAARGYLYTASGGFMIYPIFLTIGLAIVLSLISIQKASKTAVKVTPYNAGLNYVEEKSFDVKNYYLTTFATEKTLTKYFNYVSIALIAVILGGAIL
ncbi:ech hydrogenase subunit A [Caldanaerobacter subterraneus subsp. tengcongensis MB4]|uniref:NADH:ubiquinone oxidoreductase subunit 5 (Chain L)/Multisubunit Na+/H+ antiporter, MnhA subunit n=2 Tax=Caldanaerobacter subterraneus TaxID=911092 RepID=Q8RDB8_CALS4|nr:proton-conducting transporter membrane subunit [Caldanaerobacter subterraneus]AAM23427.1 NADH:ubiquinone oxidoreductase subunit 5 (chain L)/Multisubunit Na+/H+ antiporter, MnhA subunit [Caldanaerobacter subterraneus subsp. tengcongensis MB4]MBE3578368.1 NADH-quinone oxidoreductase subunit L [Caldanaerobacter subterraneus]MCS3917095.1 ech hydrogenase subunit A [Caldanaerobacter subterraneus subsp. tengcongensis MB4]